MSVMYQVHCFSMRMDFKLQWQMNNVSWHPFSKVMDGVGNRRLFCDRAFFHVQLGSLY